MIPPRGFLKRPDTLKNWIQLGEEVSIKLNGLNRVNNNTTTPTIETIEKNLKAEIFQL